MSVVVECTITIKEKEYEDKSMDEEVFMVSGHMSSTGTFYEMPRYFIDKMVKSSVENANRRCQIKLNVLKGEN